MTAVEKYKTPQSLGEIERRRAAASRGGLL
jgi:hypothetical protein